VAQIEIIPESIQLIKMSDEEYFSEKYKEYISNSKLSMLNPEENGSFENLFTGFDATYSDSFALGTAVHSVLLQPDEYTISDIKKPNGKLGLFAEEVIKYRQDGLSIENSLYKASESAKYYEGQLSNTRIKTAIKTALLFYLKKNKSKGSTKELCLSESVHSKYTEIIKRLNENPNILESLYPTNYVQKPEIFNEFAILCEIIVTLDGGSIVQLKIKGKLDNFIIYHDSSEVVLIDLKTTGKPVNFFMGNNVKLLDESGKYNWKWINGSFQKYRYYRQIAMYMWLLQCTIQKEFGYLYKYKSNMLVIETIPNYQSKIYPVTNDYIKFGLTEMKTIIVKLAEWMNQQNKL
jgi:hypothetical protein